MIKDNTYTKNNVCLGLFNLLVFLVCSFLLIFITESKNKVTVIFYIIMIGLATGSAFLAQNINKKRFNIFFYAFSACILVFLLGFRNYSGIDDPQYRYMFEVSKSIGPINYFMSINKIEPGYLVINYFVGLFTNNYFFVQFISSLIPLVIFYYAFYNLKDSCNIAICVFLLSTILLFQILASALVRIFIASSIVFYSFKYIMNKNSLKYIISILIASLFHYSALIMLIFVYLAFPKEKQKINLVFYCLIVIVLSFIVFKYAGFFFSSFISDRYLAYSTGLSSISIGSFDTLPIILCLFVMEKYIKKGYTSTYKSMLLIYFFSLIYSLLSSVGGLGRIVYYTNTAMFILFPVLVSNIKKDNLLLKCIISGCVISYGFLFIYMTKFNNIHSAMQLFPYCNIWFTI